MRADIPDFPSFNEKSPAPCMHLGGGSLFHQEGTLPLTTVDYQKFPTRRERTAALQGRVLW